MAKVTNIPTKSVVKLLKIFPKEELISLNGKDIEIRNQHQLEDIF